MKTKNLILLVLVCTFCAFSVQVRSNNFMECLIPAREIMYECVEQDVMSDTVRLISCSPSRPARNVEYECVNEPPHFPGGIEVLQEWIQDSLKYPKRAVRKKLSGIVNVQFTVDRDGTLRDIVIVESSNPIFNDEAMRLARKIPNRWIPGREDGKRVAMRFTLPINFNIK
jgi:TonB family protein